MKLRIKLAALSLGVISAIIAVPTLAFAAIPNSSTGQISSCRLNLTGVIRIIDAQAGASCIIGETPLNWGSTGGTYAALGTTDSLVTDSGGVITHLPTTITASCLSTEVASNGILMLSGPGASTLYAQTTQFEGDHSNPYTLVETALTGSGYYGGQNIGVPNVNMTVKYWALCVPVPVLPS